MLKTKTLKIGLLALLLALGVAVSLAAPTVVLAQGNAIDGSGSVPQGEGLTPPNCEDFPDLCKEDTQNIRTAVIKVVNYFLGFLGLVCVVIIVYAGVQLVLSVGNDAAVKKATKIIQYMVLGLILVFLAYAIVNFAVSIFESGNGNTNGGTTNVNGRIFTNAPNPGSTPRTTTLPSGGVFTNQPNPGATPIFTTFPSGGIYTNQPGATPMPGFTTLPSGGIYTNAPGATPVPGIFSPRPTGGIFSPFVPRNGNVNGVIYGANANVNRSTGGLSNSNSSASRPTPTPPPSSGSVSGEIKALQKQLQDYIDSDRKDADELRRRIDAYSRDMLAALKSLPASPSVQALADAYRKALEDFRNDPNAQTYQRVLDTQAALTSTLDRLPKMVAAVKVSKDGGTVPLTIQFDGSLSSDPTGTTIPASSYVWWYDDSSGKRVDLPRSPVVTATFETPNTYVVHLLIKGHGDGDETVLDDEVSVPIRAQAPDGGVGFTVNGFDVTNLSDFKVALDDARKGVRFDPKPSMPRGGFRFTGAQWTFGDNTFPENQQDNIGPVSHAYSKLGKYTVTLKLTDNGGKILTKSVTLEVVPVVARLSWTPKTGTTDTSFAFKSSASSTPGGYKSLKWIIRDSGGKLAKESAEEEFAYSFPAPGKYTVRLEIADNAGNLDSDQGELVVTSKKPVAKLVARTRDSESPNIFILDASGSYDPDGNETLKYEWEVDGEKITLQQPQKGGARGLYRFDRAGERLVTVTVSDGTGNTVSADATVRVANTLSGAIQASPRVARVQSPVEIAVNAPGAAFFLYDYGDGTKEQSGSGKVKHTYERAGIYTLRVTLFDEANNENTLSRKVFIGNLDQPVAVSTVKLDGEELRPEPGVCGTQGYRAGRSDTLQFSSDESINRDGSNRLLDVSWNFSDGTVSTTKNPSHKFTQLSPSGKCFQAVLTVIDRATGKTDRGETMNFLVENQTPTLKDITLSASSTEQAAVVRATAVGAADPDGKIVEYRWFYHVVGSDEHLGVHVTTKPQTTFTIPPREGTGETRYVIGVEMTDNDGLRISSEDVIGESERVIVADSLDAALDFKLSVSNQTPAISDPVTFDLAFSENVPQGSLNGKLSWDFDGDGRTDSTASQTNVSYVYPRSGSYQAAVTVQTAAGPKKATIPVTVKDAAATGPVAAFLFKPLGNMVLFQNRSRGSITSNEWDMDLSSDADGDGRQDNDSDASQPDPTYMYQAYGNHQVRLTVTDSAGRTDEVVHQVETSAGPVELPSNIRLDASKPLQAILITLPEVDYRDNAIHLTAIDNRINMFAGYSRVAAGGRIVQYVIDQNVYQDTDKDGVPDNDFDNRGQGSASTGSATTFAYAPTSGQIAIRLTVIDDANRSDSMTVPVVFDDRRTGVGNPGTTGSGRTLGQAEMANLIDLVNRSNLTSDKKQRLLDALRKGDAAGIEEFKDLLDNDPAIDGATRQVLLDALGTYVRTATPTVIDGRYVGLRRQLLIDLINRSNLPAAKKAELIALANKGDEKSLADLKAFIENDPALDSLSRQRLLKEIGEYVHAVTYAVDIDAEIQRIKSLTLEAEPLIRIRINRALLNLRAAYGTDARAAQTELDTIRTEVESTDRIEDPDKEQVYKSLERISGSLNPSPITEYPAEEAPVMGPPVPVTGDNVPTNGNANAIPSGETPAPSSDQPLWLRIILSIVRFVGYGIAIFFGLGILLFIGFMVYKKSIGDDNLDFEEFILDMKAKLFGGKADEPAPVSESSTIAQDIASLEGGSTPAATEEQPADSETTVESSGDAPSWLDISSAPTDTVGTVPSASDAPADGSDSGEPKETNLADDIFGPSSDSAGKSPFDFDFGAPAKTEADDIFGSASPTTTPGTDIFGAPTSDTSDDIFGTANAAAPATDSAAKFDDLFAPATPPTSDAADPFAFPATPPSTPQPVSADPFALPATPSPTPGSVSPDPFATTQDQETDDLFADDEDDDDLFGDDDAASEPPAASAPDSPLPPVPPSFPSDGAAPEPSSAEPGTPASPAVADSAPAEAITSSFTANTPNDAPSAVPSSTPLTTPPAPDAADPFALPATPPATTGAASPVLSSTDTPATRNESTPSASGNPSQSPSPFLPSPPDAQQLPGTPPNGTVS